jgi:hypothetical protein
MLRDAHGWRAGAVRTRDGKGYDRSRWDDGAIGLRLGVCFFVFFTDAGVCIARALPTYILPRYLHLT